MILVWLQLSSFTRGTTFGMQRVSQSWRRVVEIWRHLASAQELGEDVEEAGLVVQKEHVVEMVTVLRGLLILSKSCDIRLYLLYVVKI